MVRKLVRWLVQAWLSYRKDSWIHIQTNLIRVSSHVHVNPCQCYPMSTSHSHLIPLPLYPRFTSFHAHLLLPTPQPHSASKPLHANPIPWHLHSTSGSFPSHVDPRHGCHSASKPFHANPIPWHLIPRAR